MILSPRGVEDILPDRTYQYQWLERKACSIFSLHGYDEIRTPTFEKTELFLRSVGQETDAGKQMYTFLDKKGRKLSLRPEATASVARAYLEHKLDKQSAEWRLYYIGSMFRYERPQAGRLREFRQIGVEVIGQASPYLDVEIISIGFEFFREIGLADFDIQLNSIGCKKCRPHYERELKKYLKSHIDGLCSVCKNRLEYNTLRILDCKNKECYLVIEQVPLIKSYLCEDCQIHFQKVKVGLKHIGIRFNLNPRLVRGLDYYTRTVFEFVAPSLGAQDTICGGGRYDDLVEELGGPSTPAAGFSIGIERLLIALNENRAEIPCVMTPFIYIATLGEANQTKGYQIAALFRSQGIRTWLNLSEKSLSSQLKIADKKGIKWVMIVGEREVTENRFILRNMQTGNQEKIDWADLKQFIKRFKSTVCSI